MSYNMVFLVSQGGQHHTDAVHVTKIVSSKKISERTLLLCPAVSQFCWWS